MPGPAEGASGPLVGRRLDLPASIVAALDRLGRAQRVHRQRVASAHGVTALQVDLLLTVAAGAPPEPSVGALAREVGVTQPTATDSLRTLARKGLVAVAPSATDRRRRIVSLTADGHRLVTEVDRADEAVRGAVAGLDVAEQEATLRTLLGIIARFVDSGLIEVARTCLSCRFHQVSAAGTDHCTLLGSDLAPGELRVNCPEHVPAPV